MIKYLFSIGNFCSKCCENCIQKTGDKDARCCDVSNGVWPKKCYSPRDCFECQQQGLTKKIVNKCTDPGQRFLYEGKTSCCYGQCYDNRCYTCEGGTGNIIPNYDTNTTLCCDGIKKVKTKCNKCDDPKQISDNLTGIQYKISPYVDNICAKHPAGPDCCYGTCWDSQNILCSECDENTKKHKPKCPPEPDSDLIECCGGECWVGPEKDPCTICDPVEKKLKPKPNCECCSTSDGKKKTCCPPQGNPGKTACCSTSGECYNPNCERCD